MVKIRLKRLGSKKNPFYRIVVINSSSKREGAPIQELGNYNPKTKELNLNKKDALEWIKKGAQPSDTVAYLINKSTDDGKLIYEKKSEQKLSKKAAAKLEAEKAEKEAAKAKEAEEVKAEAEAEETAPAAEEPAAEAETAPAE